MSSLTETLSTLTDDSAETSFDLPTIASESVGSTTKSDADPTEIEEVDVPIPSGPSLPSSIEEDDDQDDDQDDEDDSPRGVSGNPLSKELAQKYVGQNGKDNLYDEFPEIVELGLDDFRKAQSRKLVIAHPKFRHKFGLIMAYSPRCPHCTSSETIGLWRKLANMTKGKFQFGAVNCMNRVAKNDVLSRALKVEGYPSIYLIRKDKRIHPYNGRRSVKDLLQFVCDKVSEFCQ